MSHKQSSITSSIVIARLQKVIIKRVFDLRGEAAPCVKKIQASS